MDEILPGLWRWTGRHPEWHPGAFGAEVACYAARTDAGTLLVDPLVTSEQREAQLEALDGVVHGAVQIAITNPYHVRSSEELAARYDGTIHGHRLSARRLKGGARFQPLEPGETLAGGAVAHPIGKPRRSEMPLELQSHKALVFGDAVVETGGGSVRVWDSPLDGDNRRRWWHERYLPTLQALAELDVEHVLPTHGQPVLKTGKQALRAALEQPPWSRPGS
jgi:hypothetical protein